MHGIEAQNEIIRSSNAGSHVSQDITFHLLIFWSLELIQSLLQPLDLLQQVQWVVIQALSQASTLYIFNYWKDSNLLLPPCMLIQRPHFPLVNAGICHFLPEACSIFIQCSQTVYFSNRFVGMLMEVRHRLRMQLTQIIFKTQWAVSIETEVLSFSFKLQICAPWLAGDVPRDEGWVTPTEVYQHPCSGKCSQSFEEKTLGDC